MSQDVELAQVLAQARDIARLSEQPLSSAHVLLALFTVPNAAELLLLERQVSEETVLQAFDAGTGEPPGTLDRLASRARQLAEGFDLDAPTCLHWLAACTKEPASYAYRLLEATGISMPRLRGAALRFATHGVPAHLTALRHAVCEVAALEESDAPRDTVEMPAVPGGDTVEVPSMRRAAPPQGPVPQRSASEAARERRATRRGRRRSDRAAPVSDEGPAAAPPPDDVPSPFVLNRERFPWLTRLGRNLSHLAWIGRLDPVIGRDAEIEQAIDVLNKRRSNNPCFVGEPGVGKTAVAEGLAARLAAAHESETAAPDRVIIQVDVGAIVAGTHLRGALAERLRGLQDEVRRAAGRVVVFIDELHTLMGAGAGDGGHDAANELKTALARGEFPCIGATTVDEYRQHIEADPALERRFTAVHVDEPDVAATLGILAGVTDRYAAHHGVTYQPEALEAAVRLGRRYLHERRDPDKSLGVLDLAGAVARRAGADVDRRAVAEVIARTARVPLEHLLLDDPQRILQMEAHLGERIVGQRHALTAMAETIRRSFAGFAGGRPIGSFLLLGPTGVGKTEAVKALAHFLFGSTEALTRFDMSEYLEAHTVARLIGAPPGYVGHGEGGQLTDVVRRRPYQVVLFDEIEKSHRDVWNVLLQVLDDGRLTDGRGRTVDFSNTVIVMTSNLGADAFGQSDRRIGFGDAGADPERAAARVLQAAQRVFPPELWNRIESRLVFHPLSKDEVRTIAGLLLAERSRLLEGERSIGFSLTPAALDHLIEHGGYDVALGARPMRQAIARHVESPLAALVLAGEVEAGQHVRVDADAAGALTFAVRAPD